MKILNSLQIKSVDQYTIRHEPISSLDLMERAGHRLFENIIEKYNSYNKFIVCCGSGNNGGDGLVIARLLHHFKKDVEVCLLSSKPSNENSVNLDKIIQLEIPLLVIENEVQLSSFSISSDCIIIDAIFGIGINQPLEGIAASLIQKINASGAIKIAIDLPSGLSPDLTFQSSETNTILAQHTLSVQLPKLAFMFAENNKFIGDFKNVNIGLSDIGIHQIDSQFIYIDESVVQAFVHPRNNFGHKGSFGHAMIIAGGIGKIGASILSAKAALISGCGLLTAFIPEEGVVPMHCAVPEAMVMRRTNAEVKIDYSTYDAIGIGPGIGTMQVSSDLLFELLNRYHSPFIIDADGINCLANNPTWYGYLKSNIILTPHPGEFDRLTHAHENSYERYLTQQHFSKKHQVTIVLKGHHTSVTTPSGLTYFNSTGNHGMATAGSGDVLTGVITSLCAQGYSPEKAAVLGTYLHGFAGDSAAKEHSMTSLIASNIIEGISSFFKKFEQ